VLLKATRFGAIILGSFNFGLAAAHAVELRPKRRLSGEAWLTVQTIYADFGRWARLTMPGALLTEVAAAALARRQRRAAILSATAAAGTLTTIAIWRS
jgi:hypothetical protein